jgi:predicted lactoylglutathione lyase
MIGMTGSARPPIVNVRATRDVERLPWVTSVLGPGAAVGAGVLGGDVVGGVATGVRLGVGAGVAGAVGSPTGVRAGVGSAVGGMVGLAAGVGMAEGTADGLPAAVGGTLAGAWDGDPGTDGDGGAAAVQATTAAATTATRIRAAAGGRHRAAVTRDRPLVPRVTVIGGPPRDAYRAAVSLAPPVARGKRRSARMRWGGGRAGHGRPGRLDTPERHRLRCPPAAMPSAPELRMPSPRFSMVVLLIEDLARSVAFYRRLGVAFPDDVERRRDVQVSIGGDHQLVLTTTFARSIPDLEPPSGGSRVVLEFFVDGPDEVDATYAKLTGAGYPGRRAPFVTDFGAYMAMVDDPDGNTVLVTAG